MFHEKQKKKTFFLLSLIGKILIFSQSEQGYCIAQVHDYLKLYQAWISRL